MKDLHNITAATLRERLASTQMPRDPFDIVMPPGSDQWPVAMREQLVANLVPASVLVPVIERAGSLTVLLTQRSAELRHHAGQVSFPGGRMEEDDTDILATALRETHEEVGIAPDEVSVLGYLQPMPTITGYAVTPVIGLLAAPSNLILDASEVEYTFEVPLHFLLDQRNQQSAEREFRDRKIQVSQFVYADQRIWGATAHILIQLRQYLIK
jgi:8-oxo-dGTP pyrophosphatase MutT (NUDIX family)